MAPANNFEHITLADEYYAMPLEVANEQRVIELLFDGKWLAVAKEKAKVDNDTTGKIKESIRPLSASRELPTLDEAFKAIEVALSFLQRPDVHTGEQLKKMTELKGYLQSLKDALVE